SQRSTEHKLLLAIAFHGSPCWPSIPRLAKMIRRQPRQTRSLLRKLGQVGYLTIRIQKWRTKSNTYTINRQKLVPVLPKTGNEDCRSKPAIQTAAELKEEKEGKKRNSCCN